MIIDATLSTSIPGLTYQELMDLAPLATVEGMYLLKTQEANIVDWRVHYGPLGRLYLVCMLVQAWSPPVFSQNILIFRGRGRIAHF